MQCNPLVSFKMHKNYNHLLLHSGGYLGPVVSGVGVLVYGLLLQALSVCGHRGSAVAAAADDSEEAGLIFSLSHESLVVN